MLQVSSPSRRRFERGVVRAELKSWTILPRDLMPYRYKYTQREAAGTSFSLVVGREQMDLQLFCVSQGRLRKRLVGSQFWGEKRI